MQLGNNAFIFSGGSAYYEHGSEPGCHTCEQCGRTYKHLRTLSRHKKFECGKDPQFGCPICSVKMKDRSNLYKHIRSVHRIEPLPKK